MALTGTHEQHNAVLIVLLVPPSEARTFSVAVYRQTAVGLHLLCLPTDLVCLLPAAKRGEKKKNAGLSCTFALSAQYLATIVTTQQSRS